MPTTVRTDDELVRANSKFALISGIMGFVAAGPGILALTLGGPEASLALASAVYAGGLIVALRLPQSKVAMSHATSDERVELHAPTILLGVGGMGLLRGIVGFLSILIAFGLRSNDHELWEYGLIGAGAVGGSLLGAVVAPKLRDLFREDLILMSSLALVLVTATMSVFLLDGVVAAFSLAAAVGIAGSAGKLAFDSIVQRDAPDANRGRSFARFETRFQIIWVIGASIAVIPMSLELGYVIVLFVSLFATFTYGVGLLAAQQRSGREPTVATAAAIEVEARMSAMSGAAKKRAGRTARSMWSRIRSRDEPSSEA